MKTHFRCSHMRISYYEFLKSHQNIDLGAKRRFFFLHFLLERIAQSQENLQLEVVCFAFCDNWHSDLLFLWLIVMRSEPVLRDRVWAFLPPPAAALPAPPALRLPTRLPGSFSHCWEEQDAATAAGSKLSTSTSLKKKKSSHSHTQMPPQVPTHTVLDLIEAAYWE